MVQETVAMDMRKLCVGDKIAEGQYETNDPVIVTHVTSESITWKALNDGKIETILFSKQRLVRDTDQEAFLVYKIAE
jgi:hypothetical protein